MAHGQRLFRAAAGEEKIARRADAWGARREGVRHAEGEVEPRGYDAWRPGKESQPQPRSQSQAGSPQGGDIPVGSRNLG